MKGRTTMYNNTALDTTVSYFRTTLDPYDLYRISDIINKESPGDTTTPAASLATHLRSLNPTLRWYTRDGLSVVEQVSEEVRRDAMLQGSIAEDKIASFFFFDAAVFDNGDDDPTIIANLRYSHRIQCTR